MGSRTTNKFFGDSDHDRNYYFTEFCHKRKEEEQGFVVTEENRRSKGACLKVRLLHAGMGMVQGEREVLLLTLERKGVEICLAESRQLVCSDRNDATGRWVWCKGGACASSLFDALVFLRRGGSKASDCKGRWERRCAESGHRQESR